MQRIRKRVLVVPLIPAFLIGCWAAVGALGYGFGLVIEQFCLVFIMWSVGGELSLLIFGIPLLLGIRRRVTINLVRCIFVSVAATIFATAVLNYLVPGRVPWHVAFMNMSFINVPCGMLGGVILWLINFKGSPNKYTLEDRLATS